MLARLPALVLAVAACSPIVGAVALNELLTVRLPLDRSRLVEDERELVASGIHSRRRAADELGVEDPEQEYRRWLEEQREVGAG